MTAKELTKIVDEYVGSGGSPQDVLEALAEALWLTADHLKSSWNDRETAKLWEKGAKRLDKIDLKL